MVFNANMQNNTAIFERKKKRWLWNYTLNNGKNIQLGNTREGQEKWPITKEN